MKMLPVVEFEGKEIKPSRGVYHCPYGCGRSDYPKPSWKTERGFKKHLADCPMSPSAQASKQEKQRQQREAEDLRRVDALAAVKHKIGDSIYYVREVIVSPTHVQRGNRLVHVRYEPVKRVAWGEVEVVSINWHPNMGVYFNEGIWLSDLCSSQEEARTTAERKQAKWDEHVEFSEMYR